MRTMKSQVASVPLTFPFAEQFHAIAVCLWDLLILVGWSACNSFCFSSLGDPLLAVSVCCISAVADPLSLSVLVALSSAVCYCSKLWNDQRGGWGGTNCFNICSGRDGVDQVRCVVEGVKCSGRCKVLLLLLWYSHRESGAEIMKFILPVGSFWYSAPQDLHFPKSWAFICFELFPSFEGRKGMARIVRQKCPNFETYPKPFFSLAFETLVYGNSFSS